MQDHELYAAILGIQSPWRVESVDLQLASGEVHVRLGHTAGEPWPCAECGALCRLYDHQAERRWRHLDTCQYRTILHAEPPRTECPEHGVKVVGLPWAEAGGRFTALFEALAICWLKSASQAAVADLLRLSWDGCMASWIALWPAASSVARRSRFLMWAWMRRPSAKVIVM